MKVILLFQSVHQVTRAERILKENGLVVDLVPVPREISSDCGVALELGSESKEKAIDLLREHGIPIPDCYLRTPGKGFEKWS